MATMRPLMRASDRIPEVMRWVAGAVSAAQFELEHALELADANQLPQWLREGLTLALADVEQLQEPLGR